jgi:hypothetical protein
MWALTNPKVIYTSATILSIISTDILSKIINISLDGLQLTFTSMSSPNANISIKKYKEIFEMLDIELKLRLLEIWLNHIDTSKIKSDMSLEIVYNSISETCHKIAEIIGNINNKIEYHNKIWFSTWRNIYLDEEVKLLEKNVKILDERIKLINLIN